MLSLTGNRTEVMSLAFSPDGLVLAAAGKAVTRWNLDTSTRLPHLDVPAWRCSRVLFTPDGTQLLGAGSSLWAWDSAGIPTTITPRHIRSVSLAPAGDLLYGITSGTSVARWRAPDWSALRSLPDIRRAAFTTSLAIAPDGGMIALLCRTGHNGRTPGSAVALLDARDGKEVARLLAPNVDLGCLAFAPAGGWLAAAYGPVVRVWDVAGQREVWKQKPANHHVTALVFMTDGRHLLAAANDQTVRMFRSDDGILAATYTWEVGRVTALAVAGDGTRAAAGGSSGRVVMWDLDG
jgi:WD40 repeat protein